MARAYHLPALAALDGCARSRRSATSSRRACATCRALRRPTGSPSRRAVRLRPRRCGRVATPHDTHHDLALEALGAAWTCTSRSRSRSPPPTRAPSSPGRGDRRQLMVGYTHQCSTIAQRLRRRSRGAPGPLVHVAGLSANCLRPLLEGRSGRPCSATRRRADDGDLSSPTHGGGQATARPRTGSGSSCTSRPAARRRIGRDDLRGHGRRPRGRDRDRLRGRRDDRDVVRRHDPPGRARPAGVPLLRGGRLRAAGAIAGTAAVYDAAGEERWRDDRSRPGWGRCRCGSSCGCCARRRNHAPVGPAVRVVEVLEAATARSARARRAGGRSMIADRARVRELSAEVIRIEQRQPRSRPRHGAGSGAGGARRPHGGAIGLETTSTRRCPAGRTSSPRSPAERRVRASRRGAPRHGGGGRVEPRAAPRGRPRVRTRRLRRQGRPGGGAARARAAGGRSRSGENPGECCSRPSTRRSASAASPTTWPRQASPPTPPSSSSRPAFGSSSPTAAACASSSRPAASRRTPRCPSAAATRSPTCSPSWTPCAPGTWSPAAGSR